MDFSSKRFSIAETKQIDLVGYLASLGFQPSRIRGHSPLHQERTPSFVVNRARNSFNDFGLGKGGSLIDFRIAFHRCSIPDFLQLLSGNNFVVRPLQQYPETKAVTSAENRIRITGVLPLGSPLLELSFHAFHFGHFAAGCHGDGAGVAVDVYSSSALPKCVLAW